MIYGTFALYEASRRIDLIKILSSIRNQFDLNFFKISLEIYIKLCKQL